MMRCLACAVVLVVALMMVGEVHAQKGVKPVRGTVAQVGPAIVLQNGLCRYEIGTDGVNRYFGPVDGKHNLCEPGQPFMRVCAKDTPVGCSQVTLAGDIATVAFDKHGVTARVRLQAKPGHFALEVVDVQGAGVQWLQLCNLRLTLSGSVGTLVNAAWDDQYGACVMACNDRTDASGEDMSKAALVARCHAEYGLVGARVAIIGTPTGKTEPGEKVLAAIGRMELAEGLPHPLVNGVWLKQSPERFRSYLMVHDLGEANADKVIAAAKGGFGCIEFYPWRSTPSYEINTGLFPHGLEGLKAVADKIHAAGMQVGLHCMQGMAGWGPKDDRYISPKADPRLLQDPRGTLATAIEGATTTLALQGGTKGWPERGDLFVEGEIIQYEKRTDAGFEGVKRGLHGTTVTVHPAGAPVGLLVNCFPIWGHTVYCPDVKTDMVDEICQRLADLFNAVGADMSYFDGGEELNKQPPYWHNQGLVALGVQKRVKKPVVLEGNALYTNLAWHVITRGSPHFDPIYFGRRDYTLRFKGTNPAGWAKNLLTGDVGWFAPHLRSLATDAVTPDEVMLLCLKAVGGKSPISFSIAAADLDRNPRMPEMLEIIRACDELKRTGYFSPAALAELTKPRAECHLEQTARGEWLLRPMQFGPPQVANAATADASGVDCQNPYAAQEPFVRLRARAALAKYGDKANVVLADPAQANVFVAEATAAAELTQSVELADEKTPDGGAAVCYRVENKGTAVSQWTKLVHKLPQPVDLSQHRRLGLWVKSNGAGGLLNVQLTGTDKRRDHYVPLDFTGWRLVELQMPEDARFWDLKWPYTWTDLFYTCWAVYQGVTELDLYVNAVPAGAKVECLIGRIEALHEIAAPVQTPALEANGQKLTFPVTLQPEEYVELDWTGRCRHFDPNGKLLATPRPQGRLELAAGANRVAFSCVTEGEVSTRATVELAVRGTPLPHAKRRSVKGQTARYEGLLNTRRSPGNAVRGIPPMATHQLQAGVAERVITPPVGAWLLGPVCPAEGVHDDLFARALVLTDGTASVAVISLDLVGMDFALAADAEAEVRRQCGADGVLLLSSHTHSAPFTIPWSLVGREWLATPEGYAWREALVAAVGEAVREAADGRTPVTLRAGRAPAQAGLNRRTHTADGVAMRPNRDGVIVPWVDVLCVDREEGTGAASPLAVLFAHAAHPVVVHAASPLISADYPGYAVAALRRALGDGVIPVFAQSCGANINAEPLQGGFEAAERVGEALAAATMRALATAEALPPGPLRVVDQTVALPLRPLPPPEECERFLREAEARLAQAHESGATGAAMFTPADDVLCARDLLARAERRDAQQLTLRVGAVAIGESWCLLGLTHEVFAEYQLWAEEQSPFAHTMVAAYTNGCESYVPTAAALSEGGYEGASFPALGAAFRYPYRVALAAECETQVRETVQEVLHRLSGC